MARRVWLNENDPERTPREFLREPRWVADRRR